MKALTLTQPWASLVAIGAKKIETRSWGSYYRGPLLIHAGKNFPKDAQSLVHQEPFCSALRGKISWDDLKNTCGKLIGIVTLDDVKRITQENKPPYPEEAYGDYTPGRFQWSLGNAHELSTHIPMTGSQLIWEAKITSPLSLLMRCPVCNHQHLDIGEWGSRLHKTHRCDRCKHEWRPFEFPTVGGSQLRRSEYDLIPSLNNT